MLPETCYESFEERLRLIIQTFLIFSYYIDHRLSIEEAGNAGGRFKVTSSCGLGHVYRMNGTARGERNTPRHTSTYVHTPRARARTGSTSSSARFTAS